MEALQQKVVDKSDDSKRLIDCIQRFREVFQLSTNDLAHMMVFNHKALVEIESTCEIPPSYTYKLLGMIDELKNFATLDGDKKNNVVNELYIKLKNFIAKYR